MGDGRFGTLSLQLGDVFVEVRQAARRRLGYVAQLGPADHVSLQEARQRALQRQTSGDRPPHPREFLTPPRPPFLTLSWNSVMSHSSASGWLPRFSAAMNLRMFSCLMPGVMNTSLSVSQESLFCKEEEVRKGWESGRLP